MKVAIPHWQGRVSPVFDVAANVRLVEVDNGIEVSRREMAFEAETPSRRAARLAEAGADVLVCGAISRPLETAVTGAGIEVIPQTCGDAEGVLAAFIDGRLQRGAFLMPGCRGRQRRFRCGRGARRGRAKPNAPPGNREF
ncbi:MAG: NifB/NifX family molybdenum-iron cluster-binding protein [Planctomycetota bacterium]